MENNRKVHGNRRVHGLEDRTGAYHSRILLGTNDINGLDYRSGATVISIQYAYFMIQ